MLKPWIRNWTNENHIWNEDWVAEVSQELLLKSWNVLTYVISVEPKADGYFLQDRHFPEGGVVTIVCSLIEGDPPLSFHWTKDGDLATSLPGVKVDNHDFSSTLTIMAASLVHSGNYYCKMSNPVSWSIMKATVFVDGTVKWAHRDHFLQGNVLVTSCLI